MSKEHEVDYKTQVINYKGLVSAVTCSKEGLISRPGRKVCELYQQSSDEVRTGPTALMAPLHFSQIFSSCSSPDLHNNLINYAVVDAFTDTPFKGHPAAVCLLPVPQKSHWMQQVASEFNLSQTAFLVRRVAALTGEPWAIEKSENQEMSVEDSEHHTDRDNAFDIRWFTPSSEVDLCGHATLASAHLLFSSGIVSGNFVRFHTQRSGILTAQRVERSSKAGDGIDKKIAPEKFLVELNFPILPSTDCDFSELRVLSDTLKDSAVVALRKTTANDLLVELSSGEEVEALQPCFEEIRKCTARGVIVTGRASDHLGYDFISRFFAPKVGIDEDPVCGQAHCALAPFWAKKLEKENLTAYQASKRGGTLHLRVDPEAGRAYLQGEAVLVMSGVLLNKL